MYRKNTLEPLFLVDAKGGRCGFWVVPVLLGRLRGDVPWAGVAAVRGQGGVGYHELPVISEIFILGLAAGYLLQVRSVFFLGGVGGCSP